MISPPLAVALTSLILAQLLKPLVMFFKEGRLSGELLFSTGGMPSSHSALVSGLCFTLGALEGIGSYSFGISLVLAMVVVYDAIGVRRETGRQATLINKIQAEIQSLLSADPEKREVALVHLKELLGHEPLEAFSGVFLGILVGVGYLYFF